VPGVPHGRQDGLATVINNLRTGLTAVGNQQSYPNTCTGSGYTTAIGSGGYALLDTTNLVLGPPYGPAGGVTNGVPTPKGSVLGGIARQLLVSLSAVFVVPSGVGALLLSFTLNNGSGVTSAPDFPVQVSGGTGAGPLTVTCSATYLLGAEDGVLAGGNSMAVIAQTDYVGAELDNVSLWALAI